MKSVFFRLIESKNKAETLKKSIDDLSVKECFSVNTNNFAAIPRSPFAYWVGEGVRNLFHALPALQSGGRFAAFGPSTKNDFRYLRLAWEIESCQFATSRAQTSSHSWVSLYKGGHFAMYYADSHLVLNWADDGYELKADIAEYRGQRGWGYMWTAALNGHPHYFRPGITWPRRTNGLSFRVMPAGAIFGDKGPAVFVENDSSQYALALLALLNSQVFGALVALQLARTELAQSYEVGLIQQTPIPELPADVEQELAGFARNAWTEKRDLDKSNENSHAFVLPALLQETGTNLLDRASSYARYIDQVERKLASLQAGVDEHCFTLYGISEKDRGQIESGFSTSGTDTPQKGHTDQTLPGAQLNRARLVSSLLSWLVGVAFGRFDVSLATGDRPAPNQPEPFAPLPICSPGMLTGHDGLPLVSPPTDYPATFCADGILVEDQGHKADLITRARAVIEQVIDEPEARWHEVAELLGTRNQSLRTWISNDFFPYHIKQYSKSRRKAPIYWQLATPSASYCVWCYYHRLTHDTLFLVANDYVTPKADHEERKLNVLRQEASPTPTASQRKEISAQEDFVAELRAFQSEVTRVAPLWNPNINDGVIINFAPLWRLVPQHKPWQKECKKVWDKLVKGDYDWAHLAMHLWPERVVPKCLDDRSLAIAHGLEDELWFEDDDGKWHSRQVDEPRLRRLIADRSVTAVRAALQDLIDAPAPVAGLRKKAHQRRTSKPRAATQATLPLESMSASRPKTPSREAAEDHATDAIVRILEQSGGGLGRKAVLDQAGLPQSAWHKTITALLASGQVVKTGQKRGTRYFLRGQGEGE
jgi:hypothetical protein